ncbi:DnaJ C-terminal domain-containing protein [Spirulina subsalsa]|uniref:DnaJ C-terminal domain-containing protein n=1 Tax=Spirulina subsalsa TaxID=54311 RepID=UPI0003074210|nr:J domain-containing protein [Spirulina subsalsa]
MENFRNYYDILEVAPNAPNGDIKQSFRRLARRYHPDLNPGDKSAEEKFKAINEAYEVLSDENRRSQYDQFSRFWQQSGFKRKGKTTVRRNGKTPSPDLDPQDYPDFNRFVEELLKRQEKARSAPRTSTRVNPKDPDAFRPGRTKTEYSVGRTAVKDRPRDVEARLTLPLEKAYRGGRERIRLEDGRSLEVDMPPGMLDGQKIRLKGQGIQGGNLYLKISIEPHPRFELQGPDIFCRVPVTPTEAVLGGMVEVPTLDGLVKMNVPSGVRSGQLLRLAQKGFPTENQGRGDQLVEIEVVIPKTITPEEKELYEKLRGIESFKPRREWVD